MNNTEQNDYQTFLTNLHANLATSDDLIRDIVKQGIGEDIVSKQRIIAGEASEVYDITLQDKKHVILRIARQGYPSFQQEKWSIEQVKKVGVPVPEILFITYKTVADQDFSFCLMEKIDGEPLERGKIDFRKLSEGESKSYIVQAGELLSRIHSIKTLGYGSITEESKTEYPTANAYINTVIAFINNYMSNIAKKENLEKQYMDKVVKIIDSFRKEYSNMHLSLNHGDYGYKHFLVKQKHIVGIIDWGEVRSDTPINDFAWWDYWFGSFIPLTWLKEGYQDKTIFDDNFEKILHIMRIFRGLEVINWYNAMKYETGLIEAIRKLLSDVNYFYC